MPGKAASFSNTGNTVYRLAKQRPGQQGCRGEASTETKNGFPGFPQPCASKGRRGSVEQSHGQESGQALSWASWGKLFAPATAPPTEPFIVQDSNNSAKTSAAPLKLTQTPCKKVGSPFQGLLLRFLIALKIFACYVSGTLLSTIYALSYLNRCYYATPATK